MEWPSEEKPRILISQLKGKDLSEMTGIHLILTGVIEPQKRREIVLPRLELSQESLSSCDIWQTQGGVIRTQPLISLRLANSTENLRKPYVMLQQSRRTIVTFFQNRFAGQVVDCVCFVYGTWTAEQSAAVLLEYVQ